MRYNSLRSQFNWHSRQQTHIFKKLNKNPNEKQIQGEKQIKIPQQQHQLKGNQLIWLQKMMKQLHQYKQQSVQKQIKSKISKDTILKDLQFKEKCPSASKDPKINLEKQKKIILNIDEPAKSAKKIKFQVVVNQQKQHSTKKCAISEPKSKPKSAKKSVTKIAPKKNTFEKLNLGKELPIQHKQVTVSCPSNTKVIEIDNVKTDPYSLKQTDLHILEDLWKKQSQSKQVCQELQVKLTNKKSVGKIIRNNQKMNKTCIQQINKPENSKNIQPSFQKINVQTNYIKTNQNSSYKQYKQSKGKSTTSFGTFQSKQINSLENATNQIKIIPNIQESKQPKIQYLTQKAPYIHSKSKYEKIFIKLQTQKLSEYLFQNSQVKVIQEPNDKIIDTNQYEKYCTSKLQKTNTNSQIQDTQKSINNFQRSHISLRNESKKKQFAPREKSQQRKLNKFAQAIKPTPVFDLQQKNKQNIKSVQQSIIIPIPKIESQQKQGQNRFQVKLKRKYQYIEEQIPSKAHKLFTLHSVSSDYSSNQQKKEFNIPINPSIQSCRPSLSLQLEQQHPSLPQFHQPISEQSAIPNIANSQEELNDSNIKQSILVKDEPTKSDYSQQLTILFNFLDEGHRGLLTDTNCHYQALTEELKLLFSVIINQIRTKKKFYNLQKFIEESKQILEIKNEVYNNNKNTENKNLVYLILKQNLQILKKKLPLMFVKYTHTNSYFQNSCVRSKKMSLEGQSLVIDRVQFQRNSGKKQVESRLFNIAQKEKSFENIKQFDISQKFSEASLQKTIERSKRDKQNTQKYDSRYRNYSKITSDSRYNAEIDPLQPEIFLQKKYSFNKNEQNSQNKEKMSTIFLKTRGYLQNLDNYLNMR